MAGDRALPRSREPLETLRHQESSSDCTPDLIAYIHALYAKIPQAIILSIIRPFMYLAGVKVGSEGCKASRTISRIWDKACRRGRNPCGSKGYSRRDVQSNSKMDFLRST